MKKTRLAALLLCGVMATSVFAGCGSVDKETTVATFDGKEIALAVPNFAARFQQACDDDMYAYYFGGSVWDSDFSGNGVTMEDEVKNGVMDSLFAMYTLEAHMGDYGVTLSEEEYAKIGDTAVAFVNANSKEALEQLGADVATIEEYLRLVTIQAKMREAIIADADTNVSDEEANTSAYSYVTVSKVTYTDADGNSVEYTEDELVGLSDTVEAFAAVAQDENLEAAADGHGYTVSTGTFTANDEMLDAAVLAVLQGLEEGEVSDVIDTENAYYVVRLDAKTDEAATEMNRASIISERQNALYEEVLTAWQETHTWEVEEDVWKAVTFDRTFTTIEPVTETETVESTEE